MIKLKPESYWKWRHKIEEMTHAETRYKNTQHMYSMMEKDLEINRLRAALYKQNNIKAAQDTHADLKKQYEEIKLELETEIGQSLSGCSIDDVTFEVKTLDE